MVYPGPYNVKLNPNNKTYRCCDILRNLFRYDICRCIGYFIHNFLSDRRFQIRVGSHLSSCFAQENGIPQGGVLSLALFAVMINDMELNFRRQWAGLSL